MEPYEQMKVILEKEATEKQKQQKQELKEKIKAYLLSAVVLTSVAPLAVSAVNNAPKEETQIEESQEISTFEEVTDEVNKLISGRSK